MTITITDWGAPGRPLTANIEGTSRTFRPPLETIRDPNTADRTAAYATYAMTAPAFVGEGPKAIHQGFYGWLRLADAHCLRKAGVSIFDLPDQLWRDAYEEQIDPAEKVDEALEDEGFPDEE